MTVFCKSVIYIPKFALVFEECAYWVQWVYFLLMFCNAVANTIIVTVW